MVSRDSRRTWGRQDLCEIEPRNTWRKLFFLDGNGRLYREHGEPTHRHRPIVVSHPSLIFGSFFGYGWALYSDGVVRFPFDYNLPLQEVEGSVLCGCEEDTPMPNCPCAVDSDGDGLCEGFDLGPCDSSPIFQGISLLTSPSGPLATDGT